ncbi:MAG: ABC transporter ATP-binding protein [Chloroflexota bacterium]
MASARRPSQRESDVAEGCGRAFIALCAVTKVYDTASGGVPALRGVSAQLHRGEFVALVGKSGAGKSTLVNMLTGVDRLTGGEIYVAGTPVHALSEDQMALWRGLNLGIVYQSFELLPQLSLLDNVMLPMDLCGRYAGRASRARAMMLLDRVGLGEHARKPPTAISGGQAQRVAIARALANDPPIIVADEPTGNLDSDTAEMVIAMLAELAEQGKTVLVATHDEALAARAQRVLRIADGQIVPSHTPGETNP